MPFFLYGYAIELRFTLTRRSVEENIVSTGTLLADLTSSFFARMLKRIHDSSVVCFVSFVVHNTL